MESFSLLKYWRGGGGATSAVAAAASADFAFNGNSSAAGAVSVVTAVPQNQAESDEENDEDDGPFFDLEFAVPDEDESRKQGGNDEGRRNCADGSEAEEEDDDDDEEEDGDSDGEREFNFTLSSGSSNEHSDANLAFSPSDDLFFKGKLVPVEASFNGGSEPNVRPQLRVTLLKSAAKFRVFMSGLKKSKSNGEKKPETDGSVGEMTKTEMKEETTEIPPEKNENQPGKEQSQTKSKLFAVKLKVEEVPIMSLFTRDNSSRGSGGTTSSSNNNNNNKPQKQSSDELTSEENRFSKDVIMQKYLKMVKPLYIRVSRRYGEKFRLSGQLILGAAGAKSGSPPPTSPPLEKPVTETETQTEGVQVQAPTTTANSKGRTMPAKLRVVCKHLGKSRSASSAVAAAPPGMAPSRRDDSLIQQQDGIQSAILHCKRSFNASRGE
ncbi:putative membrane-associated kinase regulator 2, partial [Cucurbita argyrosperma subsp. sororia]